MIMSVCILGMLTSWPLSAGSVHFAANWNISMTTGWTGMKFCTDIHGPWWMNHTDFNDFLTIPLATSWGSHFCFWAQCVDIEQRSQHICPKHTPMKLMTFHIHSTFGWCCDLVDEFLCSFFSQSFKRWSYYIILLTVIELILVVVWYI